MENKTYKYAAFISYRRVDRKHAHWLKHELLSYMLPATLVDEYDSVNARNIKPVFLDEDDNKPGELKKNIRQALGESKYLIVICSRNIKEKPEWIDREIQYF